MRYKALCGYIRQRWDCGDTVEIEEKHTGKYGARGQTREKKRKATLEEIKKHNQWKRERDVRRLIKWNFRERDYWITLTYGRYDITSRYTNNKGQEKVVSVYIPDASDSFTLNLQNNHIEVGGYIFSSGVVAIKPK